jgi:hypothetical protein
VGYLFCAHAQSHHSIENAFVSFMTTDSAEREARQSHLLILKMEKYHPSQKSTSS